MSEKISRRRFIGWSGAALATAFIAACAPRPAEPEVEDPEVKDPAAPVVPEEVVFPKGEVARNRSLIYSFGPAEFADVGLHNLYALGTSHQRGFALHVEPMFYYTALNDKTYSHIAESFEYNDDATELTIYLRKNVEWSDGTLFTARDVAFTYNSLIQMAPEPRDSARIQTLTTEAVAVDDFTVKFVLVSTNWRYHDTECSFRFDRGIYIVPEHVFKDVPNWLEFRFNPEDDPSFPVVTGPFKITHDTPTVKHFDRRDDWWAAKTGLLPLSAAERFVNIGFTDDTVAATQMINNEIDYCLDLRPRTIETILAQAPHVITHTGREKPFGYVDWWPISMFFNTLEKPYDDRRVRWAMAYAVDQAEVVEIGWDGAGTPTSGPFPYYPGLLKYIDTIRDVLEEFNPLEVNLEKSAQLMEEAGFTKDAEDFWVDAAGVRPNADIWAGVPLFGDIAPIVAEQLRRGGFYGRHVTPPDVWDGKTDGRAMLHFFGHGGSVKEPFTTLDMYHIREVQPTGVACGPNRPRWSTEEYSEIVDELGRTPPDDPRTLDLFRDAMVIWYRELPEVPLVQWFHRIPMNTTYWNNWPTQENPYNSALWHLTNPITMWSLAAKM